MLRLGAKANIYRKDRFMKQVFIVANSSFIFGVFKYKANAIVEKQQRRKFDNFKDIHIKKRYNVIGYKLDD